jgi:hypothetical protein
MTVRDSTSFDPQQFFNLRSISELPAHRLDTRVSGMTVSNDFSGRLSVTTAEGDRITLTADLETDFRSLSYESHAEADRTVGNVGAKYTHSTIQRNFGLAVNGDLNEKELHDLEMLFQKVSNIFRGFFQGQDEDARAHTIKLAEGFKVLDSLSGLDLTVEAVRSIAVVAASSVTPGGAPAAAMAIPQPPNGTTAPTPSSESADGTQTNVPVKDAQLASLIQQILDALKEAKVESDTLRKYLPDFFENLREDLVKELRDDREPKTDDQPHPLHQVSNEVDSPTGSSGLLVAYRTVTETSISLSVQS